MRERCTVPAHSCGARSRAEGRSADPPRAVLAPQLQAPYVRSCTHRATNRTRTMSDSRPGTGRGIALPTLLCSLICGGAVAVLALAGLLAVDGAAATPAPAATVLPPAAVVIRVPPAPAVTAAPTATEWAATVPAIAH